MKIISKKRKELLDGYFKTNDPVIVRSPGRVCIIGEHTDYNGGLSISCAIDRFITITGKKNNNKIEAYSTTLDDYLKIDLDKEHPLKNIEKKEWTNYILGVFEEFRSRGHKVKGFKIKIDSNLSIDMGISSSAALEIGIARFLQLLFGIQLESRELVEISRSAENNFVGVNCGYLDQISIVYGKERHATVINFSNLNVEYIPFELGDHVLLLIDSRQKRSLSDTGYNKRIMESEEALKIIKKSYRNVKNISELKVRDLSGLKEILPQDLFKRTRHILTENERAKKSIIKLKKSDIKSLGKLMFKTHESLRFDYEVSTDRIDRIVDILKDMEGVAGARLMGGGFGGSVISVVKKNNISNIKNALSKVYGEKYGISPDFIECLPSNGVQIISKHFIKNKILKDDKRYLIYYNFN